MPFHGGLDWGNASHAICVINETGQVVVRIEVRHDADGLADMLARLKRIAPPAELPIAIERPPLCRHPAPPSIAMAALEARSSLTRETILASARPAQTGVGGTVRTVGGLRSERWAPSDQNAGRH